MTHIDSLSQLSSMHDADLGQEIRECVTLQAGERDGKTSR